MNQKPNKISCTTNSGNFVTKYDTPLTFSLIDFAPSCKIEWVSAVDETDNQSHYNMILGHDFKVLNSKLQQVSYPILKIQDILICLNGLTYAMLIDLNMVYYSIRLTPKAQKLCTKVFTWGKHSFLKFPMGIAYLTDLFQSKVNQLIHGLNNV
jgi:hypothetical protein